MTTKVLVSNIAKNKWKSIVSNTNTAILTTVVLAYVITVLDCSKWQLNVKSSSITVNSYHKQAQTHTTSRDPCLLWHSHVFLFTGKCSQCFHSTVYHVCNEYNSNNNNSRLHILDAEQSHLGTDTTSYCSHNSLTTTSCNEQHHQVYRREPC